MEKNEIEDVLARINLIALLDHAGRAGGVFFLTIFDQHPEVICCPWMNYIYSYFITDFGLEENLDSKKAHDVATKKSYFKYVYNDLNEALAADINKFGGNTDSVIDRKAVRIFFDKHVFESGSITRKRLISLMYLSFAIGVKKDISKVKYFLVGDAVSLRTENILSDPSGKTIIAMKKDFNQAKLISLVRDPRANFASNRHQFINSFGNLYDIRFGNYFSRFYYLLKKEFRMDRGCVQLYWLCCFASTARTIFNYKIKFFDNFNTIKNEDLNLSFFKTMKSLVEWLEISFIDEWGKKQFEPTMVGLPWAGIGAYNNRYQKVLNGPLQNDSQDVSLKVTGPNKYITERWKTKMKKNEIYLIEKLFYDEMIEMKYEFMYYKKDDNNSKLISELFKPLQGEIPTLAWIINGRGSGSSEVFNRIFYSLSFVPFYLLSRFVLLSLIRDLFFNNDKIEEFRKLSSNRKLK